MIGIDEVGRGAWAGPLLVVAAQEIKPIELRLRDSKKLSKKQREGFKEKLRQFCNFGEGWVEANEIDEHGLAGAMRLGVKRALENLDIQEDEEIIMDGNVNYCPDSYKNVKCVIKADDMYPAVSAASIYAKVTRDDYMAKLKLSDDYNFATNVGYGTSKHRQAIVDNGVTEHHRKSFKPIAELL